MAAYPEDRKYMPHELRAVEDPAYRDRPLPIRELRAEYYRLEDRKAAARRDRELDEFRFYAEKARAALAELHRRERP